MATVRAIAIRVDIGHRALLLLKNDGLLVALSLQVLRSRVLLFPANSLLGNANRLSLVGDRRV